MNSFSRLDEDVGQTGLYMNPALAMVNHSCTPNGFVQFIGRKAMLHAYQEIEKDEEIEISYIGKSAANAMHNAQPRDLIFISQIVTYIFLTARRLSRHAITSRVNVCVAGMIWTYTKPVERIPICV